MSSINNSKKNNAGNLLPQRTPLLGKYIALAIILHIVFVTVYIYFTYIENRQQPEVSTPPVKILPLSIDKKELIRRQDKSAGAPSFRIVVRPTMPPRLTGLPDPIGALPPPRRPDNTPINMLDHPPKTILIAMASIREVYSARETAQEMEAWPEKLVFQQEMRLAPFGETLSEKLSEVEPEWQPALLPIISWKKLTGLMKHIVPARSEGMAGTGVQIIYFKDPVKGSRDKNSQIKTTYLSSKMVLKKESEFLTPLSDSAPLLPELPRLIEDFLTDTVKLLIQPALQRYANSMIGIQIKNMTYRDLGLESEGTKFISGLIKSEIERQGGLEFIDPADISRKPQILIEGEMWDDSGKIKVHLRTLDHGTGHIVSTSDMTLRRTMIPDKVEIQPPPGGHLTMIKQMVELIKQYFPRGGDFQLGVWPAKGLEAVYVEGEPLIVHILSEKDAYLLVDYYQIDGNVVHLLPSQHESNYISAGASFIIGDPKRVGYEFKVCEPFGEELIVVVASGKPIDIIAQGLIEPAEPYIKRLSERLGRQRKESSIAGTHYIILTKKRDSEK